MKALSLFSGIGGIDLACEWAGIETVAFCEREPFCQMVLKKHWPNVPIYDDVTTLTTERLEQDGIGTIDLVTGGYPCQPESLIGKGESEADERFLWPYMFRCVSDLRPSWVIGENVVGHVTRGMQTVCRDLESIGYKVQPFVIPAAAVGAPHERYRVFVVAHSGSKPKPQANQTIGTIRSRRNTRNHTSRRIGPDLSRAYWETHQPPVCGVDDGLSQRFYKDRMKALGNAVVPQQIYPIIAAIKQIDDMLKEVNP